MRFFTEIERFHRHLEKLRRASGDDRVHYVSICSPNYLHDSHIRLALRAGAHAICEKPIVINPWNLDPLQELERESGQRISTVLQLRLHPAVLAFRETLAAADTRHQVTLTYITARGRWYDVSWKGSDERSGKPLEFDRCPASAERRIGGAGRRHRDRLRCKAEGGAVHRVGAFHLERALRPGAGERNDAADLPFTPAPGARATFRSMTVDGAQLEFSEGFGDLHTRVYEEILAGRGCGIDAARPSVELTHQIRHAAITNPAAALTAGAARDPR